MKTSQHVPDLAQWRPFFDAHEGERQKATVQLIHITQDLNDPHQVVMFAKIGDRKKAEEFFKNLEEMIKSRGMEPPQVTWFHAA